MTLTLPPNPFPLVERAKARAEAGDPKALELTEASVNALVAASPASMLRVLDPSFTEPVHVRLIDQHLVAQARGVFDNLMIVAPPRHSKSMSTSKAGPLWRLRHTPAQQGLVTHSDTFSEEFGGWVRNQIASRPELGLKLRRDTKSKSRWSLVGARDAGMWSVGIGGSITGRGFVHGHADDLVKNMEEAQSATAMDKQWEWWVSTFLTRRTRTAGRVSMSACWTRWREDDVGGRILATERDRWCVLHLRAVAESDESIGDVTDALPSSLQRWEGDDVSWDRKAGEALWPEVYGIDYLSEYMSNRYVWSALFQGEPTPTSGGLFRKDDFRYWRRIRAAEGELWELRYDEPDGEVRSVYVRPKDCRRFATADLAASTRTAADFTVIAVWAVTPSGDLLLLDRYRGRIGEDRHWSEAKALHARWGFSFLGVEKGFVGSRLVYDAGRAGLKVRDYDPRNSDKITRAMPAVDRYGAGQVWHPDPVTHPWVASEWEPEMLGFGGGGSHDDQVDALSQAVHFVPNPGVRLRRNAAEAPDDVIGNHIRSITRQRRRVHGTQVGM